MAEFYEVIKRRKRMCESYEYCQDCGLSAYKNGKNLDCDIFVIKHPQEAEKIIMAWEKERPIKTNADKFKEVFGIELNYGGNACLGILCGENECEYCNQYQFWEREYVEPKGL